MISLKRYNVQGSWPALVTPFGENDDVNLDVLRRLIDFHVEYGSNGVLLLGSTGEPILLTARARAARLCPFACAVAKNLKITEKVAYACAYVSSLCSCRRTLRIL